VRHISFILEAAVYAVEAAVDVVEPAVHMGA
jgi:hypothetical protein